MKIALLPGDGIGPEIMAEAVKVLDALELTFETETAPVGGAAYEAAGHPLPEATLQLAKAADAILFGAVGDWKYDECGERSSFTLEFVADGQTITMYEGEDLAMEVTDELMTVCTIASYELSGDCADPVQSSCGEMPPE